MVSCGFVWLFVSDYIFFGKYNKMENAEEIFHFLEEFSKRKPKIIPQELNEYLAYVARTGDPVYQWSLVKSLFKEKLLSVITDFYETTPSIEIPPYPNVDPFNYDIMKNSLLERLDSFTSAPFTVQRLCELLTFPRKQYNRVDKFMRAIEKNILVVSTREPGIQRHPEPENGELAEPMVNGSDNNSEYNVDVEMEDMSWKDQSAEQQRISEPQPSSSDAHISVDDLEAQLKAKQDAPMDTHEKVVTQYEAVTPPEINVNHDEQSQSPEIKTDAIIGPETTLVTEEKSKIETATTSSTPDEPKVDAEMKPEGTPPPLIIPEIKVDDAEMTEQRLIKQSTLEKNEEIPAIVEKESEIVESKTVLEPQQIAMDDSSSDSTSKEDAEPKLISEISTSSEESSSSSDNTDGNSNSPKVDERHIDIQEESNQSSQSDQSDSQPEENVVKPIEQVAESAPTEDSQPEPSPPTTQHQEESPKVAIQSDNYSITDVNSELPQPPAEGPKVNEPVEEKTELNAEAKVEEVKADNTDSEPSKES